MSSFPPKNWVVRYLKDMDSIVADPGDVDSIHVEALLAARPAEGLEGTFRFTLAGSAHLETRVAVTSMLPDPAFEGMFIEAQLQLGTQVSWL